LLWPRSLPAVVFGCLPGLAVLVLALGMQWLLQRRYRRQVVFMPAFTRVVPGSSVLRGTGSSRQRHEPSTVDAPPGILASEIGSGTIRLPGREPGS
jgi:hypothetical protein